MAILGMENRRFRVKAILLDLDGTIVDSRKAYLEAVRTAFAAMGRKSVDISLVTEIPKRIEQTLAIDDLLNGMNVKEFLRLYLNAYYEAIVTLTKPIADVPEALRRLSGKALLALITMRHVSREEVVQELQRYDLAKYFQEVVTGLDTQLPKPSPQALTYCAKRMNLQPDDCIVVGDSVVDVRAGKRAGIKTVAVLSGIFSRADLEAEKPDLIIENVSKLPDFLE